MNNNDGSPLPAEEQKSNNQLTKEKKKKKKAKKKFNWWPIKAMVLAFFLSFGVNVASNVALEDSHIVLAYTITLIIIFVGVLFDIVGTAATSCEVGPFLSMAARKVKGAKMAVTLSKNSHAVSSICCDVIGDICGIVSGVCAASIVAQQIGSNNLWLSVLVYALISTLTITAKAIGKSIAVSKSNDIIMGTAKMLSLFKREGK